MWRELPAADDEAARRRAPAASGCATSSCSSASSSCPRSEPARQGISTAASRSCCGEPAARSRLRAVGEQSPTVELAARHGREAAPATLDEGRRERRGGVRAVLPRSSPTPSSSPTAARYFDPKQAGQGPAADRRLPPDEGYFRDDEPLYELILDDAAAARARRAVARVRLHHARAACGSTRTSSSSSGPSAALHARGRVRLRPLRGQGRTSEAKIKRLAEVYLAKAQQNGASDEARRGDRRLLHATSARASAGSSSDRLAAEPSHLDALLKFAERAYRRPLTQAERDELLGVLPHACARRTG